MKAPTIIIAAFLFLQASVLFAGNSETRSMETNEAVSCEICILAPITPTEASFEEVTEVATFSFDFLFLAPVTPEEADFSEVTLEMDIVLTILAPETPAEADFNDNIEDLVIDLSALAPVTPAEADFE